MRRASLFTALALLAVNLSAEVQLKRVWPGYRDAAAFDRIGEYFGAAENPVTDILVRSDPTERAGYYWLIRTVSDDAMPAAQIDLAVVLPGQTKSTVHSLSVAVPAGNHSILAGLTGSDWPAPDIRPVAWQLRLRDSPDRVLATYSSFLWRDDLSAPSTNR